MKTPGNRRWTWMMILFLLSACRTIPEESTNLPVLVQTDTLIATDTPTSTTTTLTAPSSTATLTRTPILPTPNFPGIGNDESFSEFFRDGFTSDCEFPCWYGLKVGVSGPEDVQRFFEETIQFNGTVDFWGMHRPEVFVNAPHQAIAFPIEGLVATGYIWQFPEPFSTVAVATYMDESTERLNGVYFWSGEQILSTYTILPSDCYLRNSGRLIPF